MEIDNKGVTVAVNDVAIEIARGAPRCVDPVDLIVRVVLRALKPIVLRHPFHGVVFMRARQREDKQVPARAHHDQLRGAIDVHPIGRGYGIPALPAILRAFDNANGKRGGACWKAEKRGRKTKVPCGAQELAPARTLVFALTLARGARSFVVRIVHIQPRLGSAAPASVVSSQSARLASAV